MNVVPRSGGNIFSGHSSTGARDGGREYPRARRLRRAARPNELIKIWDIDGGWGGPIRKDRLWFFLNARTRGDDTDVTGMYYNKNANDPTKWTYEPDLTQRAVRDDSWKNISGRVTWQASPRNKVNIFWDEQKMCIMACYGAQPGGTPTVSPEASETQQITPAGATVRGRRPSQPAPREPHSDVGFNYGKERQQQPRSHFQTERLSSIPGGLSGLDLVGTGLPRWRTSVSHVTGSPHESRLRGRMQIGSNLREQSTAFVSVQDGVPNQVTEYVWNFSQHNVSDSMRPTRRTNGPSAG